MLNNSRRGFMLLEVLAALVITSVAALGILHLQTTSFGARSRSLRLFDAMHETCDWRLGDLMNCREKQQGGVVLVECRKGSDTFLVVAN